MAAIEAAAAVGSIERYRPRASCSTTNRSVPGSGASSHARAASRVAVERAGHARGPGRRSAVRGPLRPAAAVRLSADCTARSATTIATPTVAA